MSRVESVVLGNLTPHQALEAVDGSVGHTDKVHEEFHDLGNAQSGLLVYEQYFARVNNRIALVVAAENFSGETRVRVIATGSSQGLFLGIDWGAADSYVDEVLKILSGADSAG